MPALRSRTTTVGRVSMDMLAVDLTPVPGATPGNLGPWYALIAGLGVIVAAMYLLIMVGKVVFGPLKEPAVPPAMPPRTIE